MDILRRILNAVEVRQSNKEVLEKLQAIQNQLDRQDFDVVKIKHRVAANTRTLSEILEILEPPETNLSVTLGPEISV